MAFLLAVFHTAWLIPYAVGTYSIETTGVKYSCPQANMLKAANYGVLLLFVLSAILEWSIAGIGLRGGLTGWVACVASACAVGWVGGLLPKPAGQPAHGSHGGSRARQHGQLG